MHRTVYEHAYGVVLRPEDFVCHTCDNPACLNVAHLFLGDDAANSADKVSKGRQARGFMKPNTVLSEQDVQDIRDSREAGERNVDLARRYGVSPSHVSKIVNGRTRWPVMEG